MCTFFLQKRVDRINLLYQNVLTSINFKKSVYKRMMSQNFDKEVEQSSLEILYCLDLRKSDSYKQQYIFLWNNLGDLAFQFLFSSMEFTTVTQLCLMTGKISEIRLLHSLDQTQEPPIAGQENIPTQYWARPQR